MFIIFWQTSIYGFHDERSGRIFLHLSAPSFDARALTSSLSGNESDKDFRTVVSSQEFKDAKLLLLMFHVCHILVRFFSVSFQLFDIFGDFPTIETHVTWTICRFLVQRFFAGWSVAVTEILRNNTVI